MRAERKARRALLTVDEREQASNRACEVLLASPSWSRARTVALFHAMPGEVSTAQLLQAAWSTGRSVVLPVTPPLGQPLAFRRVQPDTPLVRAHYGALEPGPTAVHVAHAAIDLVVTPGLAFDDRGARLGYGGGYYDRTLPLTGPSVLLAFACQQVERVPEEAHDVRMHAVVTESGWMRFT